MAKNYNLSTGDTSCRIGEVRFSYPYVFTPKKDDNGNEKYSCSILIPKDNKAAVELIKSKIEAAKQAGKSGKWGGKIPGNLHIPLRDGDEEKPDDEAYAGCYFFNASNTHKPKVGVIDFDLNCTSDAVPDTDDFYAGCYGLVNINFYPYDNKGSRGIAASLGNLAKTQDGERFGKGGESLDSSFADLFD